MFSYENLNKYLNNGNFNRKWYNFCFPPRSSLLKWCLYCWTNSPMNCIIRASNLQIQMLQQSLLLQQTLSVGHTHCPGPTIVALIEQFQKFLVTQPHVMFLLMSSDVTSFVFLQLTSFVLVMTTDETPIPLAGTRSICTSHLSLSNFYYNPNLMLNLVFFGQLYDSDFLDLFSSTPFYIQNSKPQRMILIGKDISKGTLYIFPALVDKPGLGTTTKTNVLNFFNSEIY